VPRQRLIHVHPGASELNRIYQPALAINSGLTEFAAQAILLQPEEQCAWDAWTRALRQAYRATLIPPPGSSRIDMAKVIGHLQRVLPENAILTNGAGNYTAWIHRYFQFGHWRTQLAPTSGAMGYGVPAGIAAAIAFPGRTVVSINGDGCFLMYGQELATAVRYGVAPIFLVVNNGMYGTIRMHQERHYPAREIGTSLTNPDFAAFARAFGAHGELVTDYSEFPSAFERASHAGKAALIELRVDPDAITPLLSLTQIRLNSLKSKE
jgi:acetolactate synthase-1/2/3 large subunit